MMDWRTPYDLLRCRVCGEPWWKTWTKDDPAPTLLEVIASAWPSHNHKCEGHRHMPKVRPSLNSDAVVAKNMGIQSKRAENLARYPADVMPPKATERKEP